MKKNHLILAIVAAIVLAVAVLIAFSWKHIAGVLPALAPINDQYQQQLQPGKNLTDLPLTVPDGFELSVLANNLSGARDILIGHDNDLWVSRPSAGVVSHIILNTDGGVASQEDVIKNLRKPHGLAWDPDDANRLYVAQEHQVSVYNLDTKRIDTIYNLPTGGRHTTRTLLFGLDGLLYVSIGSSCDVCVEKDARQGSVMVIAKDGSGAKIYASGLRNAVFMAINPADGKVWATEMGRDFLGDELPPDEVNILQEDKNYGWPYCYGNKVHDQKFDAKGEKRDFCQTTESATIELPAHSAPLGLAFIPNQDWPQQYQGNLIVAYHGSWNRTEPTGYKLARFVRNAEGVYEPATDFISGWLDEGRAIGRPVDVVALPSGVMYISDDKAGVVYRLRLLPPTSTEEPVPGDSSLSPITLNISAGSSISSPLEVSGSAPGPWFFEANLPLRLEDSEERVISQGHAIAQGEWMTTGQVNFTGKIEYKIPRDMDGFLVIAKDNPSGLPENNDERRIPVRLQASAKPAAQATGGCVITGCSSHICSDQETVSTCEYAETYACYKTAQCARQSDGKCGWTMTSELKVCLGGV
jgi:glucose/arabinose dehydrogenase